LFLLKPNAVLILTKNIFAFEQNDPGCIQCNPVLGPEAHSLPDSLIRLGPEQLKQTEATVSTMKVQLERHSVRARSRQRRRAS
jgi:hypothetical protein